MGNFEQNICDKFKNDGSNPRKISKAVLQNESTIYFLFPNNSSNLFCALAILLHQKRTPRFEPHFHSIELTLSLPCSFHTHFTIFICPKNTHCFQKKCSHKFYNHSINIQAFCFISKFRQ